MLNRLLVCSLLAFALQAQQPQEEAPQYPTTQRPVRPETQDEDPGRPVLKRGGPATQHETVKPPASPQPAATAPRPAPKAPVREIVTDTDGNVISPKGSTTASDRRDDPIGKAREYAFRYLEHLPNFICDQVTFRYTSEKMKPDWRYQDRVDAELLFSGQKEEYRNIRINNKRVKKGNPEESGTWSTGEFGVTLGALFASNTRARFQFRGTSTAAGVPTVTYDYTVQQENSSWTIRQGKEVKPAFKGAVWLEPSTGTTLRLEMSTRQLPADFPFDTVESVVDFHWVTIAGQKHVLPVRSENLACQRGTFYCSKNVIEFKNYRKFSAESQIMATDSDISFPEADDDKPAAKTTPPSITPQPPPQKKKPQ